MPYKFEAHDGTLEKTEFVITEDGEITLEDYPEHQDVNTRIKMFSIARDAVICMQHCGYTHVEIGKLGEEP